MTPYTYVVKDLLRAVDGDTVDCRLDLGFGLSAAFRFRLAAIDTPEVYGPLAVEDGRAATDFTVAWLAARRERLLVRTFKGARSAVGIGDGAFGRWLADFFTVEGEHLIEALVEAGHAKVTRPG